MQEGPKDGLILKFEATRYYQKGDSAIDMPDVWILGSREGLRWLGQSLLNYAERDMTGATEDHQHVMHCDRVVDQRLSDQLCLRFDLLAENREECLEYYAITPERARPGKPTRQRDPDPDLGPYTLP